MRSLVRPATWLVLLAGAALAAAPSPNEIRKAMRSGDKAAVEKVLEALSGQLDKAGVRAVLECAHEVKTIGVYEPLVATLATASGDALEELKKQADDHRRPDVRFLLIEALGKNPDRGAEEALVRALEKDKDETVAVLAARQMGKRGTASAVEALIPLLAKLEKDGSKSRLTREVNGALAQLTGQDLSVAQDWRNFWDAHKAEFKEKVPDADDGKSHTRDENALDRMRRERPGDARTMERLREDDVVVIKGKSDQVEQVLTALNLKHVLHERSAFDTVKLDPERQVLVLNCASKEYLSEAGIAKVRDFVAKGGYLFSSDWELRNTLAKAFPETVEFLKDAGKDDKKVTIRPNGQHANHPFLRDVFPLGTWSEVQFIWTIDSRSHLIKPTPALTVLVESKDMEDMGSNIVAFTFGYVTEGGQARPMTGGGSGKRRAKGGQVLHVLSHFKNQKDASGDGFALQQLLLNFIVEKQELRKELAAGKN